MNKQQIQHKIVLRVLRSTLKDFTEVRFILILISTVLVMR